MENTMNNTMKDNSASLPFFGIPRIAPYARKYSRTLTAMVFCGLAGTAKDRMTETIAFCFAGSDIGSIRIFAAFRYDDIALVLFFDASLYFS